MIQKQIQGDIENTNAVKNEVRTLLTEHYISARIKEKILGGRNMTQEQLAQIKAEKQEQIKAAKREYYRNWRAKHPEKTKEYSQRFFEKQAALQAMGKEAKR